MYYRVFSFSFTSVKSNHSLKALRFVGFGISTKFADGFAAQGWKHALPQENLNALFPRSCQNRVATDRCHNLTFCYTNHFHRMRFSGFADREPQPTGSTDRGSGSGAVGFKLGAVGFKFGTVGFKFRTVGFKFCTVGFKFCTVGFKFCTSEYNPYTACTSF
jgi:hypothetical protein